MSQTDQHLVAIGRELDRAGAINRSFTRKYFKAAGRIVNTPWSIAIGGDFAYGNTKGNKPFGTDLLNRYVDRVIRAGQHDDEVVIRLNEHSRSCAARIRSWPPHSCFECCGQLATRRWVP